MLNYMRKNARSWFVKIMFAIIIIVFVFWGIGSLKSSREDFMASVGDYEITTTDYRIAFENIVRSYKHFLGDSFNEDMIKTFGLEKKVLDALIDEKVILIEAEKIGLSVPDEELATHIETYPAFQRDGKFDTNLYEYALRDLKITNAKFEELEREKILVTRLTHIIKDSVKVSQCEVKDYYSLRNEEIDLQFVKFDPVTYTHEVTVEEAELMQYYMKNKTTFKSPEKVKLSYCYLTPQGLFSEDEIQNGVSKEAVLREVRTIYGMSLKFGSLKKAADEKKLDVKETDFFEKGIVPGELAENEHIVMGINKLKLNDISPVFQWKDGYVIVQVIEAVSSMIKPFEEVQGEIEEKLKMEKSVLFAEEKAKTVIDELARGEHWDDVVENLNQKTETTGYFKKMSLSVPNAGVFPDSYGIFFGLSTKNPYVKSPVKGSGKFYVFCLKDMRVNMETYEAEQEKFKRELLRKKQEDVFRDWLEVMKEKYQVKVLSRV